MQARLTENVSNSFVADLGGHYERVYRTEHIYKKSPLPAEMQIEGIYCHGGGAENRTPCSSASACCFANALANHWLTMRLCARSSCSASRTHCRTRCIPRGWSPCHPERQTGLPIAENRHRIVGISGALHRPIGITSQESISLTLAWTAS